MVQIATNTPSGLGRRSLSLSREARTLSMSREAVSNLKSMQSGRDRPRWGGVMRFEDAAVDGRNEQLPDICRRFGERASSTLSCPSRSTL